MSDPNSIDSIYSGGGSYLKGEELADTDDVTLTIEGTEIKTFDDGSRKIVLAFAETEKKLVVNKTNALMISEVAGSKRADDWIGKSITLYGTKVEYAGKLTDGIRVRPPQRKGTGKKAAFVTKDDPRTQQYDERNPPPHGASFNDDVPFAPEFRG